MLVVCSVFCAVLYVCCLRVVVMYIVFLLIVLSEEDSGSGSRVRSGEDVRERA